VAANTLAGGRPVGLVRSGGFGVVAAIQHVELDKHHLHIEFGNLAEWLAGGGSLAAFGAIFYASLEWRQAQIERRDQQADQARLIIAEPVGPEHYNPSPVHTRPVTVSNRSQSPVFNVSVVDPDEDSMLMHMGGTPFKLSRPVNQPVLNPGDNTLAVAVLGVNATEQMPTTEYLIFIFTDSHGRRWRRTGSGQPLRLTT
jgi:hypothetical protein